MATFSRHTLTATIALSTPLVLKVKTGELTLDDTWSPYVQATLVCALPNSAQLETIDPRANQRVTVTQLEEWGDGANNWNSSGYRPPVSRTFDLIMRERVIDRAAGEITIALSSDEGLLQDKALVSATSTRSYGLSIKAAVTLALATIGATLATGSDDANVASNTLDLVRTNLIPNPAFRTSLGAWLPGGNYSTMTRVSTTAGFLIADPSLTTHSRTSWSANMTGAGGAYTNGDQVAPLIVPVAGVTYTLSAWVRSNANATIVPSVEWKLTGGAITASAGAAVTLVANTWTLISNVFTAPASVGWAGPYIYAAPTYTWVAGTTFDTTAWMFTVGTDAPAFFDGISASGRNLTGLYAVAWAGTANASSSTLTNLPNSDATIWQPGVSAWEWLEPLVQVGGVRLWCDEARNWRLKKSWAVDGQINVSPATGVTRAEDTISRSSELWYDSVVIIYNWTDSFGLARTAVDVAGAPGTKTLTITYDSTIYPGAGAAAAVLARATGRGRVLTLENISNYSATPGLTLSISLPDTPIQTGTISAVTWTHPDGTMSVSSRGLTDTPLAAWTLAPVGRRWSDIPTGTSWNTYTP